MSPGEAHTINIANLRLESESNQRGHWTGKARRVSSVRRVVWCELATLQRGTKPAPPCRITITRIAPRELDDDNLVAACKAVRDEIAEWAGWSSDRVKGVEWVTEQRRGGVRQYAVEIKIEQG